MTQAPLICLLIGPGGSGKTTASKLLAQKFEKSAVIEVDMIRHMIANGHVDPFLKEGTDQLVLSTRNACVLAKNFANAKFNVIIDDCTTDKRRLDLYFRTLKSYRLLVVLLLPKRETLLKRDAVRKGRARLGTKTLELHDRFTQRMLEEKRWHVIDNSTLSPQETVDAIFKKLKKSSKTSSL